MKKRSGCEYEKKIVELITKKAADEQIEAHLPTCADCRETARVVRLFQTDLAAQSMPKTLPAAGLVWWKAELRSKRRAAARAAQPIFIVQTAAAAAVAATAVWLLLTPQFSFFDAAFDRIFAALEQMFVYLTAGIIAFAAICAALILFLRRFLPDD